MRKTISIRESIEKSRDLIERSRELVYIPNAIPLDTKETYRGRISPVQAIRKQPLRFRQRKCVSTLYDTRFEVPKAVAVLEPLSSFVPVELEVEIAGKKRLLAQRKRHSMLQIGVKRERERIDAISKRLEQRQKHQALIQKENRLKKRTKRWVKIVVIVSIFKQFAKARESILKEQSAIRIQNWFRQIQTRIKGASRLALWIALRTIIWKFRMKRNCKRRRRNAKLVRVFFQQHSRQKTFQNVICRFRIRVIRCQRYIRSYLTVQRHRRLLLGLLFDKVEFSHRQHIQQQAQHMFLTEKKKKNQRVRRNSIMSQAYSHRASKLEHQVNAVTDTIVRKLQLAVKAASATLYLRDTEHCELYFRAANNISKRAPETLGIAGFVARVGVPVNVQQAVLDPRYNPIVDSTTTNETRTTSLLCLPVFSHGTIIAACQVSNKKSPEGFTLQDEAFMVSCCKPLGQALSAILHLNELDRTEVTSFLFETEKSRLKRASEERKKLEKQLENAKIQSKKLIQNRKLIKIVAMDRLRLDGTSSSTRICVDEEKKQQVVQMILMKARKRWIRNCTERYGDVGRKQVHYHRINIGEMKELIATNRRADFPVYESKVHWPLFLMMEQNIVQSDIYKALYEIELDRLRQTVSVSRYGCRFR